MPLAGLLLRAGGLRVCAWRPPFGRALNSGQARPVFPPRAARARAQRPRSQARQWRDASASPSLAPPVTAPARRRGAPASGFPGTPAATAAAAAANDAANGGCTCARCHRLSERGRAGLDRGEHSASRRHARDPPPSAPLPPPRPHGALQVRAELVAHGHGRQYLGFGAGAARLSCRCRRPSAGGSGDSHCPPSSQAAATHYAPAFFAVMWRWLRHRGRRPSHGRPWPSHGCPWPPHVRT